MADRPLKLRALTVQQPFAWAILHGGKDVENRSWNTNYRGWVLIHAGKTLDEQAAIAELENDGGPDPRDTISMDAWMARGAVIGAVHLSDVVPNSPSRWALPGHRHFVLTFPRPFTSPIICRGALSLWVPDADLVEQLPIGGAG